MLTNVSSLAHSRDNISDSNHALIYINTPSNLFIEDEQHLHNRVPRPRCPSLEERRHGREMPHTHARQHLHDHNANLRRIPYNATNNRHGREMPRTHAGQHLLSDYNIFTYSHAAIYHDPKSDYYSRRVTNICGSATNHDKNYHSIVLRDERKHSVRDGMPGINVVSCGVHLCPGPQKLIWVDIHIGEYLSQTRLDSTYGHCFCTHYTDHTAKTKTP
jgi:hypothetical protein